MSFSNITLKLANVKKICGKQTYFMKSEKRNRKNFMVYLCKVMVIFTGICKEKINFFIK